ncbi:hypothetical protein N9R54_04615 [Pelobium sp.]|nr:hypothetical protein [Pelobium sp.]MDA9555498.1 hypothetical protein [Pelobium sp.]
MLKSLFLAILFLLVCSISFAQEKSMLKGVIFKKGSTQRISDVKVENSRTKTMILSDEWGTFTIEANLGDTLSFNKDGYQETEKIILQKQNLIIYLSPSIVLEEVLVKEKSKKQEQQEILNGFRAKGVYYNGNPPWLVYIFSPLTALNELLGKEAHNARKFGNYIQRENEQSKVDAHFNAELIKKSVAIKADELVEFMYLYRPKPEDVTYRNTYDDMAYIKKSYKTYLKNKSSK